MALCGQHGGVQWLVQQIPLLVTLSGFQASVLRAVLGAGKDHVAVLAHKITRVSVTTEPVAVCSAVLRCCNLHRKLQLHSLRACACMTLQSLCGSLVGTMHELLYAHMAAEQAAVVSGTALN
jgi:hypothetical protein